MNRETSSEIYPDRTRGVISIMKQGCSTRAQGRFTSLNNSAMNAVDMLFASVERRQDIDAVEIDHGES